MLLLCTTNHCLVSLIRINVLCIAKHTTQARQNGKGTEGGASQGDEDDKRGRMGLTWGAKLAVAGGVVGAAVGQKLLEILDERRYRCVGPVIDPLPDPADPNFVLRWHMHAVVRHM